MLIHGLHLTQIGSGDFLLEPSRSLNIQDRDTLLEHIAGRLQQARATRLYYDLSELALIDPSYYEWLNTLARTMQTLNISVVCIHMQPTAAFGLAQFLSATPDFKTALDISGWTKPGTNSAPGPAAPFSDRRGETGCVLPPHQEEKSR